MTTSSPQDSIVNVAAGLVVLAGVAALAGDLALIVFHHSIPREVLEGITRKYGWWAARRAEAFCPHNDIACVEREAKRLYEVTQRRR